MDSSNPWTGGAALRTRARQQEKHIKVERGRKLIRKEYPHSFFITLQKKMASGCDFGELTDATRDNFARWVQDCNAQCGTHVPLEAALCMRSPINIDLTIKVHVRMQHNIGDLTARYLAGEDIVDIAKGECYSPVALYKRMLIHRGVSEAATKMLTSKLMDREEQEKRLTARDIEQLYAAWAADSMNPRTIMMRAQEAERTEAQFVEWFAKQGVAFQTQKQLAEQQTKDEGRPICTPDVLITGKYTVDGKQIHWIDFKNYMGCPLPYLVRSCQEQAAKYTKRWGRGAFCFSCGIIAGLQIPLLGQNDSDPLLLSY